MNAPHTPQTTRSAPNANAAPFLPQITRGARQEPPRIVIHGGPGIGKTTLASCAPNPLFLDLEHGTLQLDVARVDNIDSWEALLSTVRALAVDPQGFKTVVIDTVDRAEWLCWKYLCAKHRVDSIEKVGGRNGGPSFGRGYVAAYEEFRALGAALDALRARHGTTIILIAHSKIEKAPNALGEEFDRWTLKVHKLIAGLFYESFDVIAYARLETFTRTTESGRTKGFGDRRVIETQESPAWVAKNRYRLPAQINLAWDELAAGMSRGAEEVVSAILAETDAALKRLDALDADAGLKARAALNAAPRSAAALGVLLNRINAGAAQREAARAAEASSDTTNNA